MGTFFTFGSTQPHRALICFCVFASLQCEAVIDELNRLGLKCSPTGTCADQADDEDAHGSTAGSSCITCLGGAVQVRNCWGKWAATPKFTTCSWFQGIYTEQDKPTQHVPDLSTKDKEDIHCPCYRCRKASPSTTGRAVPRWCIYVIEKDLTGTVVESLIAFKTCSTCW